MSTFVKKLVNPETGKEQVAVCHDDHFGHHIYGYGFKKDGSDFDVLKDFKEMNDMCDFYRAEELTTKKVMREREEVEDFLNDQRPPQDPEGLPMNEETRTRALIAINNTLIVVCELLLDIRDKK